MADTIAFDTHAYVKKLKTVGFTEEQAEVLASSQVELLEEHLATKRDLKELEMTFKQEMKELEIRLTLRLGGMMAIAIAAITLLEAFLK